MLGGTGIVVSVIGLEAAKLVPYLMRNVRTCITNVTVHLPHDADVFVTVEQGVFLVSRRDTRGTRSCMFRRWSSSHFVRLETGMRQDNNQALRVLVSSWYRCVLCRD